MWHFISLKMPSADRWDKEIIPRRGLLSVPWRELWRYRDLISLIARRDLTSQYKQTVLGPLWFIIQPVLATVAFSFLFGRLANLGTQYIPHFVFYMGGLVPWNFFADCINKSSHTFTRNSQLFSKVYFPRLAIPLANALTSLAAFAVQFALFLIGLAFYLWRMRCGDSIHLDPNWRIALLPVMLAMVIMLGLGVGLIVSSLTIRYRDLGLIVGFGMQVWMYGSSVIFALERVPAHLRSLIALNPMVPIIEGFRCAFLGHGLVTRAEFAVSFCICTTLFLVGLILFNRTEQSAMDAV